MTDLYVFEKELKNKGLKLIAGTDEAGRGPLAGPVLAAAVILDDENTIEGINDSKKLTEKRRERLYDEIIAKAKAYSVAMIEPSEIDETNILKASLKAMRIAIEDLKIAPEYVLIDGNQRIKELEISSETVVGGDAKSASIAAASILAKVSRDRYMIEMANEYPGYSFEKHKGYPTKAHYEAISELGPCKIHRRSFLKKLKNEK